MIFEKWLKFKDTPGDYPDSYTYFYNIKNAQGSYLVLEAEDPRRGGMPVRFTTLSKHYENMDLYELAPKAHSIVVEWDSDSTYTQNALKEIFEG